MEFLEKVPDIESYNKLRINSGKGHEARPEMADIALHHSLYLISVWEEGELIGLGRVVGDGAITFTVTDIMVDKRFQRRGIGGKIMDHINAYLDSVTDENSFIMLIARIPSDKMYIQHGFEYLQEGFRVGMLRDQSHKKQEE